MPRTMNETTSTSGKELQEHCSQSLGILEVTISVTQVYTFRRRRPRLLSLLARRLLQCLSLRFGCRLRLGAMRVTLFQKNNHTCGTSTRRLIPETCKRTRSGGVAHARSHNEKDRHPTTPRAPLGGLATLERRPVLPGSRPHKRLQDYSPCALKVLPLRRQRQG